MVVWCLVLFIVLGVLLVFLLVVLNSLRWNCIGLVLILCVVLFMKFFSV